MHIRNMKIDDIESIKDVYADAFGFHRTGLKYYVGFSSYLEFCIQQGYAFVAEEEGNVVGYVLGYTTPDMFQGQIVYIENLAVITEFQNKGIGKALIAKIEEVAIENNIKQISLRTGCYRNAYHVYCHLGFRDSRDDQRYLVRMIERNNA